jgi:hypothetical protein
MARRLSLAPCPDAERLSTRATVFGLDVVGRPLPLLLRGALARATGRALELVVSPGGSPRTWPRAAELICDQREADGSVSFRIEHDRLAGYLIEGPAYGSFLLAGDGGHVGCMPGERGEPEWQRLLIAQVLPFAAVLRGLEVLHASAVADERGAVVLAGRSGAGKTTLALELCRRGARFLADDVLVLEQTGQEIQGHPGSPVAGLAHEEARRLHGLGLGMGDRVLGVNRRERLLRMSAAPAPAPLHALFFLERRAGPPSAPEFEALPDARMLLAATFNTVLRSPKRLRALLELCATLATRRVERLTISPGTRPEQVAEAIERRLSA